MMLKLTPYKEGLSQTQTASLHHYSNRPFTLMTKGNVLPSSGLQSTWQLKKAASFSTETKLYPLVQNIKHSDKHDMTKCPVIHHPPANIMLHYTIHVLYLTFNLLHSYVTVTKICMHKRNASMLHRMKNLKIFYYPTHV